MNGFGDRENAELRTSEGCGFFFFLAGRDGDERLSAGGRIIWV